MIEGSFTCHRCKKEYECELACWTTKIQDYLCVGCALRSQEDPTDPELKGKEYAAALFRLKREEDKNGSR